MHHILGKIEENQSSFNVDGRIWDLIGAKEFFYDCVALTAFYCTPQTHSVKLQL